MDKNIIQAYLWRNIIRLGFSPIGDKDRRSWLYMYGKSLKDFWEVDEYPPSPKSNGSILAELTSSIKIHILIDYSITDISNFTVRFLHISNTRELMWTHDVDSKYFSFPEQAFLTNHNNRNLAIENMTSEHIKGVIDALLLHPKAHQHIESPINDHKIRIGGGILNPFVFLFHLRYQLCPDKTRRDKEKERLINLFESAVKSNTPVTANKLLPST
jgi:hypothetical protein